MIYSLTEETLSVLLSNQHKRQ